MIWRVSVLALLVLSSCTRPKTQPADRDPLYNHAISLGVQFDPGELTCDRSLIPSAPDEIETITLATLADCSSCDLHLAGLETLAVTHRLPRRDYLLVWVQDGNPAGVVATMRRLTRRTVCVDSTNAVWRDLKPAHPPMTLIVRNHRVIFVSDRDLGDSMTRSTFVRRLSSGH